MDKTTSQKIVDYIIENGQASGKQLADTLGGISSRGVRKQLKSLLDKGILRKIGRPPKVYYLLAQPDKTSLDVGVDPEIRRIIDDRYLFITPTGVSLPGWPGFVAWCEKTNQDQVKTSQEYILTLKKYDRFFQGGLIDGMAKMNTTFKEVFLDKLFYLDFYSIERFGKTKLGQLLLYAKQSQDRVLIHELIRTIQTRIVSVVEKNHIDGVVFIPPTVKREVQFMKELERQLHLEVRSLSVSKIKTPIIVPQKTLTKLDDRIENARQTIIVDDTKIYKNILLIDDAVGSGATLNETARQIRKKGVCQNEIIGLAITGSFKGFDVISEV